MPPGFPTNPINALEASFTAAVRLIGGAYEFPTNPINALEASGGKDYEDLLCDPVSN